jgi:hypothetical protein
MRIVLLSAVIPEILAVAKIIWNPDVQKSKEAFLNKGNLVMQAGFALRWIPALRARMTRTRVMGGA